MFIVDSQVHIWREETPDRPWVPGARERIRLNGHREEAFSYDECVALMDEAGVNRALIIPPSWEGDRIDYALEACQAYPGRFGVMARVPQNKPAEGAAMMRDFAQNPRILGTRLTFHRPVDRNWMIDGTNDWYWPLAEELGIPTMVRARAHLEGRTRRHRRPPPGPADHQFTKHFPFTDEELDQIMGRGICECLNWPVPVAA